MEEMEELKRKLMRRECWFARLRKQYADLEEECERLREQLANADRERDCLMGDVVKLKAIVSELEAKLPQSGRIIIP